MPLRPGRLRLPLRRQQLLLAPQPQHTRLRIPHTSLPQRPPHLAVAFAGEGRLLDRLPDLAEELLIRVAYLRAAPQGKARRGLLAALMVERRPRQAPRLQHLSLPVQTPRGGRPGAAHRFDLHRRKGFSYSMCRMRSLQQIAPHGKFGDDGVAAAAPLVDQVLLPDLESLLASCEEGVTPLRQGGGRDAAFAGRGLQIGAAKQFENHTHLAFGRPPALAAVGSFRVRGGSSEGDRRGPGNWGFRVGHSHTSYRKSVSNEIVGRGCTTTGRIGRCSDGDTFEIPTFAADLRHFCFTLGVMQGCWLGPSVDFTGLPGSRPGRTSITSPPLLRQGNGTCPHAPTRASGGSVWGADGDRQLCPRVAGRRGFSVAVAGQRSLSPSPQGKACWKGWHCGPDASVGGTRPRAAALGNARSAARRKRRWNCASSA
jgi:hypothetical protein